MEVCGFLFDLVYLATAKCYNLRNQHLSNMLLLDNIAFLASHWCKAWGSISCGYV